MTEEQRKHLAEARIAESRAKVWEQKADDIGLHVLADFWKEVSNMLHMGLELQERAMRDNTLLTQKTKIVVEKKTGRLFNE